MAEVIHRYIGKSGKLLPGPSRQEQRQKAAKQKLDAEFVAAKKWQVDVRRMQSESALARARDELIIKDLVEKQAAYLLVALRQKILSIPQTYCRRLINISDSKEMAAKLKVMSLSMLEELRHLPERVTDPHWLKQGEEAED